MRCISVDLEVRERSRRIYALAAVDQKTGDPLTFSEKALRTTGLTAALEQLDRFAARGDCLVGHNLIHFDLERLRAAAPARTPKAGAASTPFSMNCEMPNGLLAPRRRQRSGSSCAAPFA